MMVGRRSFPFEMFPFSEDSLRKHGSFLAPCSASSFLWLERHRRNDPSPLPPWHHHLKSSQQPVEKQFIWPRVWGSSLDACLHGHFQGAIFAPYPQAHGEYPHFTHVMIYESESNLMYWTFPTIHQVEGKLCTHCTSGQNAWGTQLQWTSRSRMAPMVPLHHKNRVEHFNLDLVETTFH